MNSTAVGQELYQAILESLSDLILLVDGQVRIQYVNRGLHGAAAAQWIGRSFDDLLFPEFRRVFRMFLGDAFSTGAPQYCKLALVAAQARDWKDARISVVRARNRPAAALVVLAPHKDHSLTDSSLEIGDETPVALIPVCAWCRQLRNVQGTWKSMEEYLRDNHGIGITHGICPKCMERHAGETPPTPGAQ